MKEALALFKEEREINIKSWMEYTDDKNLDVMHNLEQLPTNLEKILSVSDRISIPENYMPSQDMPSPNMLSQIISQPPDITSDIKKIDLIDYSEQKLTDKQLNDLFRKLDQKQKVIINTLDLTRSQPNIKQIRKLTDYVLKRHHAETINNFLVCQRLHLDDNDIDSGQSASDATTLAMVLAEFIPAYHFLRKITLQNCKLNEHDLAVLTRMVNRNQNWLSIKVSSTPETQQAVALLNNMVTIRSTRALLLGRSLPRSEFPPAAHAIESFLRLDENTPLKQVINELLKIAHTLVEALGPHESDPEWGTIINNKTALSKVELYHQRSILFKQALIPIEMQITKLNDNNDEGRAECFHQLRVAFYTLAFGENLIEDNKVQISTLSSKLIILVKCILV